MNVLIVTDQRVCEEDGKFYTEKVFVNNIVRYQHAFKNVSIYAKTGREKYNSSEEIVGTNVYLGGGNKELYFGKNKGKLEELIPQVDLVILRIPSVLAFQAVGICRKHRVPYYAVVVGCVWDSFWNHSIKGKLLAPYMFMKMKNVVKNADYLSYVSQKFLQDRYPSDTQSLSASDATITDTDLGILNKRITKIHQHSMKSICLFTAAGLNVRYKGQQYVIEAIPYLNSKGYKVAYYLAGTGDKTYLQSIAKKYNVEDQVYILGAVSHEEVLSLMDRCDIYVQPSMQEGLPRVVVEALSRACPCIGTGAGGISELIAKKYQFKKKSARSIQKMILQVWEKEILKQMAVDSFELSKDYDCHKLEKKRTDYFNYVIEDVLYRRGTPK